MKALSIERARAIGATLSAGLLMTVLAGAAGAQQPQQPALDFSEAPPPPSMQTAQRAQDAEPTYRTYVPQSASQTTAEQENIKFPDPDSAWLKRGTYTTAETLSHLKPGLSKEQLYALINKPHFKTGIFPASEWGYLFHISNGLGSRVLDCQLLIRFDNHMLVKDWFWRQPDCADLMVAKPPPPPPPPPEQRETKLLERNLSADALFAFNRWDLNSLNVERGMNQLTALARQIARMDSVMRVEVMGYTDRIGSMSANMLLSQRRADTIKSFLIQQGVAADKINARGMGPSQPGTLCPIKARSALIRCLAPDRRVMIQVFGMRADRDGMRGDRRGRDNDRD
jgi:outer membrane protein OmpA-like peptidoglycan-associated protein